MPRRLIIVGGGLTGLSAALIAAQQGAQVTVLEATQELGGLLQTVDIGPGRTEYFYHHHFSHDEEFKWLLRQLDIEDRLKFTPTTMGVFRNGTLYPFNTPADLLSFAPMTWTDKFRFAASSFYLAKVCNWRTCEHIGALEWFRKFSGKSASQSLWEPMLKIKFGDHAKDLPLSWMAGRLRQRLNSRRGAQEMLGYMDGSLHTLLVRLEEKLRSLDVQLHTQAPVQELLSSSGRICGVQTHRQTFMGEEVLFTAPTPAMAPLVQTHDAAYAQALRQIKYFGAVCVVVETSRALSNTYWMNVADESFPFGGIIEHTNLVSPQNFGGRHVTYLSRYFPLDNPLAKMPEEKIIAEFLPGLKKIYPTLQGDEILRVRCFRTLTAAPVNELNFSQKLPRYQSPLPGLSVASMPQLYPDERSCNNCVRLAAGALKQMGYDTSAIPQGPSLAGVFA